MLINLKLVYIAVAQNLTLALIGYWLAKYRYYEYTENCMPIFFLLKFSCLFCSSYLLINPNSVFTLLQFIKS